jgi:hypothetical protein
VCASRWIACAALVALPGCLLTGGCAPRSTGATLDDVAEQYVRVTLQAAQHRPNLVESWTGPAEWQPGPRVPVAELRATVEDLVGQLERLRPERLDPTERPRRAYLLGQLRALSMITRRLLGESPRFAGETRAMLGAPLPAVDTRRLEEARQELDRLLAGSGPLEQRYRDFRRQFVVDKERVEDVIRGAIGLCRAATEPHIVLPADERIRLSFGEGGDWDAITRYEGGHRTHLVVGSAGTRDVAALLRMACHETYAGHHMQHVLIDDALVRGRRWLEFGLSPAFGPHRLITEGAAEAGVSLALPEEARAELYRTRLLLLAGLPTENAALLARVETLAAALEISVPAVVARYLDNEISSAEAARMLAAQALLPAPEQFLAFAERHRTNAVAYPIGKAVVSEWVAQGTSAEARWRRLQDLFTRTPFALN